MLINESPAPVPRPVSTIQLQLDDGDTDWVGATQKAAANIPNSPIRGTMQ